MRYIALLAVVAVIAMFVSYALDDTRAMKTCEAHSSHDECFYALNH